jgi:hypothetical protein
MIDMKEARVLARLAWNGWPDNENSRREIAAHEARDPFSASAWDRVINALVAQRIEQGSSKPEVAGSIPAERTNNPTKEQLKLLFQISKRPLPAFLCRFQDLIEIEWPEFDNNWKPPGLETLGLVRRRDLWARKYWPLPIWRRYPIWTITPAGRRALRGTSKECK